MQSPYHGKTSMKILAFVLAAASCFAADQKIIGGPFILDTSSRSATIAWIVETAEVSLQAAGGAPAKLSPAFRAEKTTYTGLTPNTRYDFEVAGIKGSFKTAPARDEPFNFVLYGDNRTRHDVHRRVISELMKHGIPDFVVQTGDMVENGADNSLWPIFFDIERDLLRQTAFFPSLGNHERNASDYFELFPGVKPYYSFNWGNAHFTVIDSDVGSSGRTQAEKDAFWAEEVKWLEDDLKAHQDAAFRFLVAHHPPYSAVASRQNANLHMRALMPLLEKYHVSAGLFGHDHNYQHYLKNGVHYVICGGGGAPLYDVDMPPKDQLQKVVSIENFVKVSVDHNTAKFQPIDINGNTIEEFTISGASFK